MIDVKKLEHCFFVMLGISILSLILFMYFGDDYMRNCCILKSLILFLFLLALCMMIIIVFCPCSKERGCDCEKVAQKCDFILVHKEKNKVIYSRSFEIGELLNNAENGDRLIIYSDDFKISPEILYKQEKDEKKAITLIANGRNEFIVYIK